MVTRNSSCIDSYDRVQLRFPKFRRGITLSLHKQGSRLNPGNELLWKNSEIALSSGEIAVKKKERTLSGPLHDSSPNRGVEYRWIRADRRRQRTE
jgi:hypothetical protein